LPSDTLETLRSLIADTCAVDRGIVKADGKLAGFGLDSVRLLDLILAIEESFDIVINESDPALSQVHTVNDLVVLVDARRAGRG
jgi:acyl carrier protein